MAERVERQPAFVLHERAYRETSALIEVFTRDYGRVGLVARGLRAQKPRFARGLLRPLQALECGFILSGEFGQLVAADALAVPYPCDGMRLQAALYVNELLVRLLARHDAHPDLFDAYARLMATLPAEPSALAFALRRFEAFALAELGYGIDFEFDMTNHGPIEAQRWYHIVPEHGAMHVSENTPDAISGRALLAMRANEIPDAADLRALRRLMRAIILHHLGGRPLNAWRVLKSPVLP